MTRIWSTAKAVLLSPSHFEAELKAAGRIQNRSMLELKLQTPSRDELTRAFQQSRELFESPTIAPGVMKTNHPVDLSGYEGVRGQRQVGAWARVEGTDWVCIAEIDHAEAFAPLSQLTRSSLYLSLAIGLLVIGLTTWLATRIVAPLNYLAGVATRLASGDRSVRCEMHRDDEIGSLATALDNMADAVEETLTDLERNADRLAESNRQLDSVIDNIPTMLFMKDADDLRIVRFNKAGLKLIGYSAEEVIGKTDFDLYPKEEAEFFVARDREVLNESQHG